MRAYLDLISKEIENLPLRYQKLITAEAEKFFRNNKACDVREVFEAFMRWLLSVTFEENGEDFHLVRE